MLNSHTHCQAAQRQCASQSLSKSVSKLAHKRKKSTKAQHYISVMRAERSKMSYYTLNTLCGRQTVNCSETRTKLILDRWAELN